MAGVVSGSMICRSSASLRTFVGHGAAKTSEVYL